jgi:repressor LexA
MEGLHPRRLEMLRFLARRVGSGGETPSQREIGKAVGLSSSQTVAHHLARLEAEGYVERGEAPSRKRRPIRLTGKGWETVGESGAPMLGRIAAGQGIEAVRAEEPSSVVSELLGEGRFLLEAAGQSMTGAGIEDGDLLLVAPDPSPPDGTVVAAFIGGERVTVKRLFREGENVRLRAENGEHQDIVVPASEVEVQGRVELILRRPWRR